MEFSDSLQTHYASVLDGAYDCVDRLVLNAYFPMLHSPGGFRVWYRLLRGSDDGLTTAGLMRMAGRFSRRIQAFCESEGIPFHKFGSGERKHEHASMLIPEDEKFEGLFAVFVARAPGTLWEVKEFENGSIDLRKKKGRSYVNHYFFHIMDREWGHITIRMCAHPPYGCMVILNGHEWVERRKEIKGLKVAKVDNCFTAYRDGEALSKVADTLKRKGRLEKVCNRWIYKCLWFGLDYEEQQRTGFAYQYSIYQVEYSRNLLFKKGTQLDRAYQNLIDLTRSNLDMERLKTIFGRKNRPYRRKSSGPGFEVRIETPDYNLTIFKIHFGRLTLKLYDKGERTLRAEVVVHNAKALKCKRSLPFFQEIVKKLQLMMGRFMDSLLYAHVSLTGEGDLEQLTAPTKRGETRLAGIDITKPRMQAVMEVVLALSLKPGGYTVSDMAQKMQQRVGQKYTSRMASYDLRKLRGKSWVEKQDRSRRYLTTARGSQEIIAILALVRKQIPMTLAALDAGNLEPHRDDLQQIEYAYLAIIKEINGLRQCYGIYHAA